MRSAPPDCVDQRDDDGDWEFSVIPNQLFWPCVAETGGAMEAEFTNNSPEVWFIESDQADPGLPITFSATGLLFASAAGLMIDQTTTAPLIPPDGSGTFQVDEAHDSIAFDAALNEPLTVANAFLSVLIAILPQRALVATERPIASSMSSRRRSTTRPKG